MRGDTTPTGVGEAAEPPALTPEQAERLEGLRAGIRELGSVAVAFSGGVDSSLLLAVAHEQLGDRAFAITARIRSTPSCDAGLSERFCEERGIRHRVLRFDELEVPGFSENPTKRCYLCKTALFTRMDELARREGADWLAEGSNMDDLGDYRPGLQAIREIGARSPLRDAGLTKADVRAIARHLGLEVWDKPSAACLSSRFAYGQTIDAERLERVDGAEEFLRGLGFRQLRVRIHEGGGDVARIEVEPDSVERLCEPATRSLVVARLRELGFAYVTVDLAGFRSGSMNEVLGA